MRKIMLALLTWMLIPSFLMAEVTDQDVQNAIGKGVEYLKQRLNAANGNLGRPGVTSLVVIALLNCDVPPDDPAMQKAYANLETAIANLQNTGMTYDTGLMAMAFQGAHKTDPQKFAKYKTHIAKCADWLMAAMTEDAMWTYGSAARGGARVRGRGGDHSNCQYAILGLQAAKEAGVEIPIETWKSIRDHFHKTQAPDGGWGYTGPGGATGSMTTAGLSSLYIAGSEAEHAEEKCGEYKYDKHLVSAFNWLAKNFTVKANPGRGGGIDLYYLYGLERAGIFSAQKYFGSHDWYKEGAEVLVPIQQPQGPWIAGAWGGAEINTSFALLFLGKGKVPILFNKLNYESEADSDWTNDVNEIKNLTVRCVKDLETPASWQIVRMEAEIEDLLKAPILYFNGHQGPKWEEKEIKKIRDYLDQGGFLFAEACCGSKEFDKNFKAIMKKVYPEYDLEVLTKDHPIYKSQYKIPDEMKFLYGMNTGCRLSVVYSPRDLSCTWNKEFEKLKDKKDPEVEELKWRIGVNVAAYILESRPMRGKLEKIKVEHTKADERVEPGAFVLVQLEHQGDWNPHRLAHKKLLQKLREEADMRVVIKQEKVAPADPNLFNYPFVYLLGHQRFEYDEASIKNLRKYLDRGGFLFAESCCGKTAFDKSFREFIKQVYPEKEFELKPVKADHLIYTIGGDKIKKVKYRDAVRKVNPDLTTPTLEGIAIAGQNGQSDRLVVVYSKYSIGCGLDGHPCPGCKGYEKEDAFKLATHIVVYAMTQ